MQQRLAALIAVWVIFAGLGAEAAHVRATLVLSADQARPGETITAGVRLQMDAGWHTYWKNPGESGKATTLKWQLPPGVTAGDIQWPLPDKHQAEGLTTYVLHDEAILLVPLQLAPDLSPGPIQLKAKVDWLECESVCIRGTATVEASLTVGDTAKAAADTGLIEAARKKLPTAATALNPRARWETSASGDTRPLLLEWDTPAPPANADFFPYPAETFEVQPATDLLPDTAGKVRLRKQVKKFEGNWPAKISGVLVVASGPNRKGFEAELAIRATEEASRPTPVTATAGAGEEPKSLWTVLVYAFLGGIILNVMPCVLPVIALKILGFVAQAREAPGRVRRLGLVYALGVLVSFLVLAGIVIGVKAAGHQAGWGIQFGSPWFIVGMSALVTLVALNLFGVFEVTLGGRILGAAGAMAPQHGVAGAFFNGVLATALATPCTAPFLSVALGFAFAQPAPTVIVVFLAVGAGLAAPYVVLSWHPAWLKFLPRPGAWMEKFKVFMGFPMLATAVWLTSLAGESYGERAWWLGIFLVFLALAAWVFGAFVQRGGSRKPLAAVVALLLLVVGYAWALDANLRWTSPVAEARPRQAAPKNAPKGYTWQPWSVEAVTQARAEGRVVVVDFTAKWCITCNSIVKPAFERRSVLDKLTQIGAVALLADYTSFSPEITEELARFNRAAVPLVLVYPKAADAPALILPDPNPLLGPGSYAGLIVDALDKASR